MIIGQTFLPSTSAWKTSGYWVAEWLPQIVIFLTEDTGLPTFCAIWVSDRLWSRRIIAVNCWGLRLGAFFIAISALVLAGLPTTSTLTDRSGDLVQRLALRREDLAVRLEQVLALHARAARPRADQQRHADILEGDHRIGSRDHALQQRERAVVEFHHHALERLLRFLVRDLEQLQDDRLVLAEHFAAGDAEQEAIADLAGCAGDCDTNGGFGHGRDSGGMFWR